MTTGEIRKNASMRLKGKMGKAISIALVYTIIVFIINYIPFVGSLATIAISPVLVFGVYKAIVMLLEGKQVKVFDFFTQGFDNFSKVWQLVWEVIKKTWIPLLLMLIGLLATIGGSVVAMVWTIGTSGITTSSISNTASGVVGIVTLICMLIGLGLIIGGAIWYCIKSLKYILVNFYLAKNPDLSAKEIMAMNEQDMQENVGKMAGLFFFYALISFGISFLGLIITYIVAYAISYAAIASSISLNLVELISSALGIIFGICINVVNAIVVMPRMVASYNELHEYITRNRTNNYYGGNLSFNNGMNNNYNANYNNGVNNNYNANYNNGMDNNYNVNYGNDMNNNNTYYGDGMNQ